MTIGSMPDGLPFNPRLASLLERHNPSGFAQFMQLLEFEKLEIEREYYESSLLAFIERAWKEIESAELSINWHHEAICETLEQVTYGQVRDVIINIPPRFSKSLITNVFWPSWIWCRGEKLPLSGPHVKFLCVSYGATLAETIAVKMLRLVSGVWYQSLWGDRVKILPDQSSRANFGNSAGGERISASVESGLIGRGGDIQVCDDIHSLEGAESDAQREATLRAVSEGLPTRITDPRISARVMVMQRLHSLDSTAWALEHWRKDLVHLMYPMRFDPTRACASDPRTEPGELLWPEVWNEEAIEQAQKEMSEYARAGQMQQMPVPRGGGIIKREWWQPWPDLDPATGELVDGWMVRTPVRRILYPAFEYIVAWVDTAFTEKVTSDFCAMTVWGVFRAEGKGRIERRTDGTYERVADDWGYPKVMLIYGWAKRLSLHGPPEVIPDGVSAREWNGLLYRKQRQATWGLVENVVDTCTRYKVDHLGIETQAAGLTLEQELRRLHSDGDWGVEVVPAKGSKEARVHAISHLFSAGQIYAPTFEDGTHPSWADPVIDEVCLFPRGRHDDLTDTVSGALAHLRSIGLFERRTEFERVEEDLQMYQSTKMAELPYPL